MTRFLRVACRAAVLAAAFPIPVFAGGVRILEPTGTQNFADIGSAVNAAPEGAVLLVGQGTYGGFTVSGKSLSILAVPNAAVTIQGRITVTSIGPSQTLVVGGLHVAPPNETGLAALEVSGSTGNVRFQDCVFEGADYDYVLCEDAAARDAPQAVRVTSCTKTAFTHCTFAGGKGEDIDEEAAFCTYFGGGAGGAGLAATGSTLVLYDCQLAGGIGGYASGSIGGAGGAGADLGSTQAFASASAFAGADGGYIFHQNCWGTGGAGCRLSAGSALDEIGSSFLGGYEGCAPPVRAAGIDGGAANSLAGPARAAVVAPSLQGDASSWSVSFHGAGADRPFLFASTTPNTKVWLPFHGAWLTLRAALLPPATLGQADGNGTLNATAPCPDLPAGSLYQRRFAQIVVRGGGQAYLGSGAVLYVLDRQSGPDCNGNGTSDFVDVIEGTSPDANHNLIPDSCPGG